MPPDRRSAGDDASPELDGVPVSVRLGAVVPPEEPEDWTRPLTWAAAGGMLLAPLVALAWFIGWPPRSVGGPEAGTWLLGAAIVVGGTLTGLTQRGAARAVAATLGAALFAALGSVLVGGLTSGSATGIRAPSLAHASLASLAGLAGTLASLPIAHRFAVHPRRAPLALASAALGVAVAVLVLPLLYAGPA
ncbi:MAG: hypothetical protein ACR2KI_07670 [Candidatus Limnocylindria bacterium]